MKLINLKLTEIQLNAIEVALENKVEEITDYYDSDDRHPLFHTLDAQIAIEDAMKGVDGDEHCECSPCPYCADDVPRVAVGYILERLYDIDETGDFSEGIHELIMELVRNVEVHND